MSTQRNVMVLVCAAGMAWLCSMDDGALQLAPDTACVVKKQLTATRL
jgi:hypothetical protein